MWTNFGFVKDCGSSSSLSTLAMQKSFVNKKVYFLSFLKTEMAQVVEILLHGRQGPVHPSWFTAWLLVTWQYKEPGHQQPGCDIFWPEYFSFSIRRVNGDTTVLHWTIGMNCLLSCVVMMCFCFEISRLSVLFLCGQWYVPWKML